MEKRSENAGWNSDTTYALGFYRFLTRGFGIWPLDCHKILPFTQFIIIIILELFMIISILGLTNQSCNFVTDDLLATAIFSSGSLAIIKLTLIRLNRNEMLQIILTAIDDWASIKTIEKRKIMMQYSQLGRTMFTVQMIVDVFAVLPIIMGPITSPAITSAINSTFTDTNVRQLPLPNVCVSGAMMSYIAIYILQSVQVLLLCTANVGCDCYFFGMTMHIVGQFECLSVDFENLGKWKNSKIYRKYLAEYVERHILLLRLSKNLEDTFNIILLFQISANVMQICMNGLRMIVSIRVKDTAATLNLIIIIHVLIVQIFFYCYSGIRLTFAAKDLEIAAYFSNWYELSPSISKDLMFVTVRASKTFSLTAGHIIEMNLESFTNIIKAVGSYFSVLQAMLEV